MSEDQEARARLARVAEQVGRMRSMGEQFDMDCPYCFGITQPGKSFCCTKMLDAVGVVVEAMEKFSQVERHLVN